MLQERSDHKRKGEKKMSDIELITLFINNMMETYKEQKSDFERGLYMGYEGVKDFMQSLDKFLDKKEDK